MAKKKKLVATKWEPSEKDRLSGQVENAIRDLILSITEVVRLLEKDCCEVVINALEMVRTGIEMREQELKAEEENG